jgi:hypothetical protein
MRHCYDFSRSKTNLKLTSGALLTGAPLLRKIIVAHHSSHAPLLYFFRIQISPLSYQWRTVLRCSTTIWVSSIAPKCGAPQAFLKTVHMFWRTQAHAAFPTIPCAGSTTCFTCTADANATDGNAQRLNVVLHSWPWIDWSPLLHLAQFHSSFFPHDRPTGTLI